MKLHQVEMIHWAVHRKYYEGWNSTKGYDIVWNPVSRAVRPSWLWKNRLIERPTHWEQS